MTRGGGEVQNVPGGRAGGFSGAPGRRRRGTALLIIAMVMALLAALVVAAVSADGRELSRTSANDGGAWVLNRDLAAVAHKNRATGELSSYVRLSDSPTVEVYQSEDLVVVHDTSTNQLFEVDQRSSNPDQAPTQLPEFAEVVAAGGSVVVFRVDPLAVWRVGGAELTGLASLTERTPLVSSSDSGRVASSEDGRIAVADSAARTLQWVLDTDVLLAPIPLDIEGSVVDVSIIDASAVVLTDLGELVVVGSDTVEHRVLWSTVAPDASELALLQQSSVQVDSSALPAARFVAAVTTTGELVELEFTETGATLTRRARLGGANPVAPISHEGCIYGVVTDPPTFGAICDTFVTQPLVGVGSQLRLRLVNGWIWVNDVDSGATFSTTEDLQLEALDDWSLAIEAVTEDESDQQEAAPDQPASDDATLVDDPDALGDVRDSDDFNVGEANEPPVAVDDEAETRTDVTTVVDVLDNDTDPNNDVLTVVDTELLNGEASIVITPDRAATQVVPGAGFTGTIQYRYSISDGRSDPVSAVVTLTVVPRETNRPPVAVTDVVATAPGEAATIDILRNDNDPDGDAILVVAIETDTGTLRWDPAGQITFTPDGTTDAGWIELPYTIADTFGAEATGRVRVEIRDRGANQEPDARNDQATTVVGRPVVIDLLANDSDPDGDPLIVGSLPRLIEPLGAIVQTSTTADGEFVFSADEPGTYLFTYTINDAAPDGSESDTARIRVDVLPNESNDPPIAVRDDVVIPIGESRVVYVLENDGDPDGDVIGIVNWQVGPGLLVEEVNDDTGHVAFEITVTPDAGATPTMTYSISDGVNPEVTAPVAVAVAARGPQNQPPFARDDVKQLRAGQRVEVFVLDNDFDPEGEPLRIVSVGLTDLASVSIPPGGGSLFVSVPDDAVSSFTVPYDIEDPAGNRAAALLRVQLINPSAANRPPIARTDLARTEQGQPVAVAVLNNDSDPDSDPISLDGIIAQPARGTALASADGSIVYAPDPDFRGTDVFSYAIVDSEGDRAVGEVFVGVMDQAVENLPPIANDDAYELNSAAITPLQVLANDRDPEGDPLRVIDTSAAVLGTVVLDGLTVSYQPPESMAESGQDTFTYVIADSAGNQDSATVTIQLGAYGFEEQEELADDLEDPEALPDATPTPLPQLLAPTPTPTPLPALEDNQPPIARDDNPPAAAPGTDLAVRVLDNDSDPDGDRSALRVVSVSGSATTDGVRVFVTVSDEPQQLSYTITDDFGARASAVINVISPDVANLPPVAVDDAPAPAAIGTNLTVAVLDNDSDPDGDDAALQVVSVTGAATTDGVSVFVTVPDTATQLSYTIADAEGAQASAVIAVVPLPAENQAPVARDDLPPAARVGTDLVVPVLENDFDPDGDQGALEVVSVEAPATTDGVGVFITVPDDPVQLSYTIADSQGAEASAFVSVIPTPNEAPSVTPLVTATDFETPITLDLAQQVVDPDGDTLFFICCDNPRGGSVDVTAAGPGELQVVFTPEADFSGQADFSYTADDQKGHRPSGSVTITVGQPGNRAPELIGEAVSLPQRAPVIVDLEALATDPDDDPLTFSFVQSSNPDVSVVISGSQATVNAAETVDAGVTGFFTYDASDGVLTTQGRIDFTVIEGENRPPIVTNTSVEIAAAASASVDLRDFTTEPDLRDSVTFSIDPVTTTGITAELTGDLVTISAASSTSGTTTQVQFTATDTRGDSATGTIDVSVVDTTVPDPSAVPDTAPPGRPGIDVEIDVLANDVDPLLEGLELVSLDTPTFGSAGISATDTVIFVAGPGEVGTATMNYTMRDQAGRQSTALITVNIVSEPDQPAPPDAVAASTQVTIDWQTPQLNGSTLQGYRITRNDDTTRDIAVQNSYVWDNLDNGTDYSFTVIALSDLGESLESGPSPTVTPNQRPEPPAVQSVTFEDRALFVEWDEPTNLGTSIDDYEIRIGGDITGVDNSGGATSFRWEPLVNGDNYTFELRAHNDAGWSDWGPSSTAEHPSAPPDVPAIGTTVRTQESGALEVNWSVPASNNGDAVIEYLVRVAPNGTPVPIPGENTITTEWSDLTNGVDVAFQVRARNRAGMSGWSAVSNAVKPCGRPDAPVISGADRGDRQATITWQAPTAADSNGCAITGYWVQQVGSAGELPASGLSREYPNLTNGTDYTFTVQAENEQGRSGLSAESPTVRPAGPPIFCLASGSISAAPTAAGTIEVTWDAATANGDPAGITDYEVRTNGGQWVSTGSSAPSYTASGLQEDTSYTFEARARNTVGLSLNNCGPASARTWARPSPLSATVVYDTTNPLNTFVAYTVTGGASPDVATTVAQGTVTLDGGEVENGTFTWPAGSTTGHTAQETWSPSDGTYGMNLQVCNPVGCADSTSATVIVVVPRPPDTVETSEIIITEPFVLDGQGRFTGVEMLLKIARKWPVPDNDPTEYEFEIERRNGPSAGWVPVDQVTGDFAATDSFPWSIMGKFDPQIGYSTHPDGVNNGQLYSWRVRVKAINAVGESAWSDWAIEDIDRPSPTIRLTRKWSTPQTNPSGTVTAQGQWFDLDMYGFAPNRAYQFHELGSGLPDAVLSQGGQTFEFVRTWCSSILVTDANGSITGDTTSYTHPGGSGTFNLYCGSPFGAQLRLQTRAGYSSPWYPGLP